MSADIFVTWMITHWRLKIACWKYVTEVINDGMIVAKVRNEQIAIHKWSRSAKIATKECLLIFRFWVGLAFLRQCWITTLDPKNMFGFENVDLGHQDARRAVRGAYTAEFYLVAARQCWCESWLSIWSFRIWNDSVVVWQTGQIKRDAPSSTFLFLAIWASQRASCIEVIWS